MKLLEHLFNVVAPHNCIECGKEGALLCAWCKPDVLKAVPSACFGCGKQTDDFSVCKTCRRDVPIAHIWYCAYYDNTVKKLITLLKFEQKRSAANIVAELMDEQLPYFEDIVVVPVSTTPQHVRERGFDHTKLIAKQFARLRKLTCHSVLVRQNNVQQVGKSKQVRKQQMAGSFCIVRHSEIVNKRVLLLDDVVTTGATLGEAARTLKQAGASEVWAATFALSRPKT